MDREVQPIINDYWTRAEFPRQLVPGMAELGIAGAYDRLRLPRPGAAVDGMIAMELARVDPLDGHVHGRARRPGHGLGLPLRLRGAEAALAAGDGPHGTIGAFGLTEPDAGSDVAAACHDGPARRRHLGARRREEVDRQRHLRRPGRSSGRATWTTSTSRASSSRRHRRV